MAYKTPRTRYIAIPALFDSGAGSAVPAVDTHGSLSQEPHWHLANAVTTTIKSTLAIIMPADYVNITGSTVNINWLYSTSVGGNNIRWLVIVREIGSTDTAHTQLLSDSTAVAAPASADTIALRTVALTTRPTAGKEISINILRLGADVSDTNTGQASVWGAYFDYLADV